MNLTKKILPESVEPTTTPAVDPCPRCGKTLVDPAGLGWCPACGYCKSLAQANPKSLLTDKKAPSLGGPRKCAASVKRTIANGLGSSSSPSAVQYAASSSFVCEYERDRRSDGRLRKVDCDDLVVSTTA